MSTQNFSAIIRLSHDPQSGAIYLRLVRTDTAQEIDLSDATFLLRLLIDEATLMERGYIRHLASGQEAYFQSGGSLQAFFKACLLRPNPPNVGVSDQ